MISKKAIVLNNTAGFIVAIIGLVGIVFVFYRIYSVNSLSEEQVSAESTIDALIGKIEALPINVSSTANLQGFVSANPLSWYFVSFTLDDPYRPGKCRLEHCPCICRNDLSSDTENCQKNGFCRPTEYPLFVERFEVLALPRLDIERKPTGVVDYERSMADTQRLFIPRDFLQIEVNKTTINGRTVVYLRHYSTDYILHIGRT